jgi:2-polyprenyl-3-methyl-5-hydroxy-6-metoxy-1,4-benzoquinol methylase
VGCCAEGSCGDIFTERVARRDARRYRRKGLDKTARRMVDFLVAQGVGGRTVLEVGGGVGAIQLELLRAGAVRAVNLELTAAYDGPAGELAREAGLSDRVERRILDLAVEPAAVEAADVVVLHRVVCCYPDAERLVGECAAHTVRTLVLSYPPRTWWALAFAAVVNVAMRLRRRDYRSYIHAPGAFLAEAESRRLRQVFAGQHWPWRITGLERDRGVASVV